MNYRVVASTMLVLSLLPALGCDKATPVAPDNSVLLISANPAKVGLNGQSTITVVGRKPDGQPLNPGTEVRLSVDKGTINPSVVVVDDRGQGTATFRADGRSGIAKITAMTGGGTTMASADIQVGESTDTKPTLVVTANPNTIDVQEESEITIIARNADGSPVEAGRQIILTTTLGSLSNTRPTTRSDGTARATFTAGDQAGAAEISAVLGSSDVVKTTITIRDEAGSISITPTAPTVDAPTGDDTAEITFTVFVRNAEGDPLAGAVVNFETGRGDFEGGDTVGVTNSSGIVTKTLVLEEDDVDDLEGGGTFTVTASTNGASGTISATATVTVR
jgi:hypothetical protein